MGNSALAGADPVLMNPGHACPALPGCPRSQLPPGCGSDVLRLGNLETEGATCSDTTAVPETGGRKELKVCQGLGFVWPR